MLLPAVCDESAGAILHAAAIQEAKLHFVP
jgi:hypothetical protein